MPEKVCLRCKKIFSVKPSAAHKRKYCSKTCQYPRQTGKVCPVCNKTFFALMPSHLALRIYCSQTCMGIAFTGKKHTLESKLKMSLQRKGRRNSPEAIEKVRLALTGRKRPPEVGQKIAASLKGRKASLETRLKQSIAGKGRKFTEDHKRKIAEANTGRPGPMKGRKFSEEHRARIGAAHTGEKSVQWAGGPITITCIMCGTQKKRKRSRANSLFCSNRCATLYRNKYSTPQSETSIEKAIEAVLIDNKIQHEKQVPILGISIVDFLLPSGIILQCDGDYWHSIPKVRGRDKWQDRELSSRGYKILRLKEHQIKNNIEECTHQILAITGGLNAINR